MKTSFTPGPWSYGGLIGKSPGAIMANGGGVQVATAKVVPLMYGQQITSEEANSNARLIAAAPELLSALRELQANPNDPRAHRSALDAMVKATGEA